MVAGAFGHAKNYGWDGPFDIVTLGVVTQSPKPEARDHCG